MQALSGRLLPHHPPNQGLVDLTNTEKVIQAMNEHAWEATYCTISRPAMECYCSERMDDHESHLATEIIKALDIK